MIEDESVLSRSAPGPDETVRYGPSADHVIDVWPSARDDRPLVLFLHGGYWRPTYDRRHTYPLANALRDAGWPVASAEYRRAPGRPGDTTSDVATALTVPLPLRYNGILLAGHSAGGHLALWAASAAPPPDLRGVLALAPVADLELAERLDLGGGAVRAFLGGPADERSDLDPARLPTPAAPVVLVQGDLDEVVPAAVARSYHASHPETRLVTLPGTGHFALIDPLSARWPAVTEALSTLEAAAA